MDKEVQRLAEGSAALKRSRQKGLKALQPERSRQSRFSNAGYGNREVHSRFGTSSAKRMRCHFSSTVARPGSIAGRSSPSECGRLNTLLHADTKSRQRRQYPTPVNFLDSNRLRSGYTHLARIRSAEGEDPTLHAAVAWKELECTPRAIPDSPPHPWSPRPPRHPSQPRMRPAHSAGPLFASLTSVRAFLELRRG
jgi:hypothetical protein